MAIVGAKCKLTPELQQQLVECIESGMYYHMACDAVGISKNTFWIWMNEGKADKSVEKVAFYDAIKKGQSIMC